MFKKNFILLMFLFVFSTCTSSFGSNLLQVNVILDWTPNTNHTGIVVAKKLGFYKNLGLNVNIIQPSKGSAEQLLARNFANFAISSQGNLVSANTKGMNLVSIAAIIAHNTSGFYSLKSKNIKTPKDFEKKIYGSWGSKLELATIKEVMKQFNADFNKVKIINVGDTNFFRAKNIDFVWGYEGWTGIKAKVEDIPVNFISVYETTKLDGYTPIIVTNNTTIIKNKDLVYKFLKATSDGYNYAIKYPEKSANILLEEYPELDKNLVIESQKYLSKKYKESNTIWGYQDVNIWNKYVKWMCNNAIIKKQIDPSLLFTNMFLPK